MEVMKKAGELAAEIIKTNEYARLASAREAMEEDDQAAGLLKDRTLLKKEYLKSAREGAGKKELEMIENLMEEKHKEIMDNEISGELVRAKSGFDNLIKLINREIMSNIEECEEGGCDNCDGCS